MIRIALALALAAIAPALAQTLSAQSSTSTSKGVTAFDALFPNEFMRPLSAYSFRRAYEQAFRTEPSYQELEAAHPGITEACIEAAVAATLKVYDARRPSYRSSAAANLEANFSPTELAQVTSFFESAAGQKFKANTLASPEIKQVLDKTIDAPAGAVAPITKAVDETPLDPTRGMSSAQMTQFAAFVRSPAGQKFMATSKARQASADEFSKGVIASAAGDVQTAVSDAAQQFVDRGGSPLKQ